MVMEKPSPLLVGREFVRQYYTLLNKAPDFLHRFYGRNSSYVHGGLDPNGKLVEAVYGQAEIHKKVMSLQFSECHTKIRHVDAHATLSDGVVVQVLGELSNNGQPMRKFMQTFVLAPEGSVANKFYVHNDIFRYEDEVFGDSEAELDEESEEEVEEEQEERQQSPEPLQESPNSTTYYEPHPVTNGVEEPMEEPAPEPEPEPEPEPKAEEIKPEAEEKVLEEMEEKAPSPVPAESPPNTQEPAKTFSWASVTSKNLPPSGTVTSSGISPHVVKAPSSQPRVEAKPETQTAPLRPRDQRTRDRPAFTPRGPRPDGVASSESQTGKPHLSFVNKGGRADADSGDMDSRRIVRYPDSHQLFVGNLPHDIDESELKDFFMTYGNVVELRINTKGVGGKLPNFGFVVFDDSDPVQKILGAKPIMFRGEVRLNVEEKKTRAVRERETRGGGDERRDMRRNDRGPGGSRGIVGSGMMRERDGRGPPPRGGMAPKPGMGSGRGSGGQGEGRFTTQRR
uniref:ras GTPase-activating protein-binding protein 2 isoform X2 n=1 Tax=Semicossyphus pulcher TaxID=241346 RepID=UPI0037E8676D